MEKRERFYNIEFLRFILAIVIVLFHFCHAGKTCFGSVFGYIHSVLKFSNMTAFGNLAVDMFFIMGGFFLIYSFQQNMSISVFVKKRLIRLYPLIILYVVIDIFFNFFIHKIPHYLPHEQILRILLIDNIGLNTVHLGLTWFVSVLFWSSLFYFYLLKNFESKYVNLLIPLIVVFCYSFLIHAFKGNITGHTESFNFVFNAGVMRGLAGIGLGYLIFQFYKTIKSKEQNLITILGCTLFEGILCFYIFNNITFHKINYYSNFVIIVAFAVFFILLLLKRGFISRILNNAKLAILGRYSYSIYIMHIFVLRAFMVFIGNPHKHFVENNLALCITTQVILAVLLGIVTYHLVEVPAAKYLKNKWFENKREEPESLAAVGIPPLGGGGN